MSQSQQFFDHINVLIHRQEFDQAIQAIQMHLTQNPANMLAFTFLAHIFRKQQKFNDALQQCNQALSIDANFYSAMVEKARILKDKGDAILACHSYLQVYQRHPQHNEFFSEWSDELLKIRDFNTLHELSKLRIEQQPNDIDAYFYAGLALQYLFKHEDAIAFYEAAIKLDKPLPAMLNNNLAAAYKETNQLDKAKALLEQDLQNTPDNYMALVNYASVLQKQNDLQQALNVVLKAIAIEPNYAISHNNLALTLREMQDFTGAQKSLEYAIKVDPEYDSAKWNLAMSYLQQGNYEAGWQMHEYRWQGSGELRGKPHGIQKPEYDGTQDIFGKAVFIWGEQGFGDAIQFARYLPIIVKTLKAKGAKVHYCCFTPLQDLFISSFAHLFDSVIIDDKHRPLPEFDFHLPLLKLPYLCNTRLETIPNQVPYLKPTSKQSAYWQERLAEDKNLKVGLVWTGSLGHQRNPFRAVWIENYFRFANVANTSFYSFQFNAQQDIAKAKSHKLNITDLTAEMQNFDASGAALQEMDLLITVCTSTAHLAGALGIPTWLLLDVNPHWVWLLKREDSPWYPNTKLYRQKNYLEWEPVLQTMHEDLLKLSANFKQTVLNKTQEQSSKDNKAVKKTTKTLAVKTDNEIEQTQKLLKKTKQIDATNQEKTSKTKAEKLLIDG